MGKISNNCCCFPAQKPTVSLSSSQLSFLLFPLVYCFWFDFCVKMMQQGCKSPWFLTLNVYPVFCDGQFCTGSQLRSMHEITFQCIHKLSSQIPNSFDNTQLRHKSHFNEELSKHCEKMKGKRKERK